MELDEDEYRATRILTGADKPDEIKVGKYGRTNLGNIIKFAWIEYAQEKRDEDKVILIDLMETETRPFYYFKKGEYIVKHSSNIIDLIEVGDFVNGKLIHHTDIRKNSAYIYYGNGKTFVDYQIKSIVTKEQFKSVEYKVGG